MDNTPNEAPAAAPAAESVATPNTNENTSQAPAMPDMHGFTSEQLADMKKFFDNNGGFDKIKARISNPEPVQKPVADLNAAPVLNQQQNAMQSQQPQQPQQFQQPKPAEGSMSVNEYIAKQYFEGFSKDPKYKQVFDGKKSVELIKEMAGFNVYLTNLDGTINDDGVRKYLDMKAETIASHQTQITPEASAAPTVDYVQVGETINNIAEARAVLRQDAQLRASGQAGHPSIEKAREFLKNMLNPSAK